MIFKQIAATVFTTLLIFSAGSLSAQIQTQSATSKEELIRQAMSKGYDPSLRQGIENLGNTKPTQSSNGTVSTSSHARKDANPDNLEYNRRNNGVDTQSSAYKYEQARQNDYRNRTILDENGNLRYLFSVNYDIASLRAVDELIQGLITTHPLKKENPERESVPKIPHTVTELLDSLIEHAFAEIGKPAVMMTKEDKIRVVHYLNDAGAFLITKSGDRVASALGISKFTLYKYMESDAE